MRVYIPGSSGKKEPENLDKTVTTSYLQKESEKLREGGLAFSTRYNEVKAELETRADVIATGSYEEFGYNEWLLTH